MMTIYCSVALMCTCGSMMPHGFNVVIKKDEPEAHNVELSVIREWRGAQKESAVSNSSVKDYLMRGQLLRLDLMQILATQASSGGNRSSRATAHSMPALQLHPFTFNF